MLLFHEFTHIHDANKLFKKYNNSDFQNVMKTFSEYHASQIEIARGIGFKDRKSYKKIDLDKTFISYQNNKIKVGERYIYPLADASCIIQKERNEYYNLDMDEYFLKYTIFEAKTMYYLGIQQFCAQYSNKKIPNITDKTYESFAPYIRKIELNILQMNFKNLSLARNELWKYYKTFFTSKWELHLPGEL